MHKKADKAELAKIAIEEHRAIEASLLSLSSIGSQAPEDQVLSLAQSLKDLKVHLEQHFEVEERQGLFEDIVQRLPCAHRLVDILRRQHPQFLRILERLIRRLEKSGTAQLETVRQQLDRFLRLYQAHEDKENDLFERAYCEDLGTGD